MDVETRPNLKPDKLNALTSLRFFAASLIVLHHSFFYFDFGRTINHYFPTYQAVSFFFVLSGFILTYVYGSLQGVTAVRSFLIARIARVWPLHAVTGLLLICFYPEWYLSQAFGSNAIAEFWGPFFANMSLVQAWIPTMEYFWSFNAVSWSISTEFGFYLFFPLLIYKFRDTWKLKLAMTFLTTIAIIALCHNFSIPLGLKSGVGYFGLIITNPVARLFEFNIGMVTALVFMGRVSSYKPEKTIATLIELLFFGLLISGMLANRHLMSLVEPLFGEVARGWVDIGGINSVCFALFILLMAFNKGMMSQFLSRPFFVFLGEISFSIYLLHQFLLRGFSDIIQTYAAESRWLTYLYFWAALLLGAYLLWQIVEKPGRNILLKMGKGMGLKRAFPGSMRACNKVACYSCVVLLAALLAPLDYLENHADSILDYDPPNIATIDLKEAEALEKNSKMDYRNILFGEEFLLRGAVFETGESATLKLLWESRTNASLLRYRVAVHFLDGSGNIVSQGDYCQSHRDDYGGQVKKRTLWVDSVDLSHLSDTVKSIGLGLFVPENMSLLPITGGERDFNNRRLLIRIPLGSEV